MRKFFNFVNMEMHVFIKTVVKVLVPIVKYTGYFYLLKYGLDMYDKMNGDLKALQSMVITFIIGFPFTIGLDAIVSYIFKKLVEAGKEETND